MKSNTVSEDTGHTFPRAGDAKTSKHVQIQPCRAIPASMGVGGSLQPAGHSGQGKCARGGRFPAMSATSAAILPVAPSSATGSGVFRGLGQELPQVARRDLENDLPTARIPTAAC